MTNTAIQSAIEAIYASLKNDNEEIDARIGELKAALPAKKEVTFDPVRLAENNRPGRRLLQTYFKKRGVIVKFAAGEENQ